MAELNVPGLDRVLAGVTQIPLTGCICEKHLVHELTVPEEISQLATAAHAPLAFGSKVLAHTEHLVSSVESGVTQFGTLEHFPDVKK